jgi:hypothetical protein
MAQYWLESDVTVMMVTIIFAPRGTKRDTVDVNGGRYSDVICRTIRIRPRFVKSIVTDTADSTSRRAEELAPWNSV